MKMKKNNKVQVLCSSQLYDRLDAERERTQASSLADVGRDLWEFALAIKERLGESKTKSNREILEEVLLSQYQLESLIKQMYVAGYNPTLQVESVILEKAKSNFKNIEKNAKEKTMQFIENKE
jgi:hypothetical protein